MFVLGGRFLVPAVLPQVKDAFTVGDIGAGVAVTVIWATYGLMQMPAGILVDRVGERRLLAGSVVLTATSVVVIGGAPAFLAFSSAAVGSVSQPVSMVQHAAPPSRERFRTRTALPLARRWPLARSVRRSSRW
ncbi:MAG: sugar phosphate permease [uncultured archaeon A07HN63]|nr:MAG: sugar phosphate permease [uncultured archaeon A07HN63]